MKYTKTKIKEIRKGIEVGEKITEEQEALLHHFGILIPSFEGTQRVVYIQTKIDGILRRKPQNR